MDKAEQKYWDRLWDSAPETRFDPNQPGIGSYWDKSIAAPILRALSSLPSGATVLEAGCADSTILPWVARQGYRIAGIDYSPVGCERFRTHLQREGLTAHVECCDVFKCPDHMLGRHDAVISIGLVEHFTDTAQIVRALAAFVRPGGRIFTLIPNMQGLVGAVQRLANPEIYAIHEALSVQALRRAHVEAGLAVVEAEYLLPTGFGVVNDTGAGPWRKEFVKLLSRGSRAAWLVDRRLRLPRTAMLSPYVYCTAQRPAPTIDG
jgi:2-polyprenyl-3-methyl-5-hydroxy-6-metoxy-1,4-benzoquinol methylase